MKKIYFTVGPTQLYPTFQKHITLALSEDICSISHRGQTFKDLYKNTDEALRKLLSIPQTHHIFFTSSSIESMERILQNTVEKYSFHIISGEFGKKFYEFSTLLQKQPKEITIPHDKNFLFSTIKIPKNTEIICVTHNDTSTGIALPMQDVITIKQQVPNALMAVDLVSSAPYGDIDYSQIDIGFFSVQKGFGLPAGLGILIVNDKAIEKSQFLEKKGIITGTYKRFSSLLVNEKNWQTFETPNILEIYLLEKITKDFLKKGIEIIKKETEEKANIIYDFFESSRYQPYVTNKHFRSQTTLVIDVKGETKKILTAFSKKGFILGSGYGKHKEAHIRIANFPAHSLTQVKQLLNEFNEL